jgi:Zn finger protein HypA/HybF involved in hydrogenase expression
MHEVSIAHALVQTVEHAARDAGIGHVTRMNVELGLGAGVTPDALAFALELARDGTVAQDAEVVYTGPGAALHEDHPHDHDDHEHEHAHDHTHDADEDPSAAMERWTVRLAWIEGT